MSFKKLNNKQVEIITDKFEIYVEKNKYGFTVDHFKSSIKDREKAHEGSEQYEDVLDLERDLKSLGVSSEDLAGLKKDFDLI